MAVILDGASGGIQLTSTSGGTASVNPPATATSYVQTLPAATGTILNSASSLAAANLTGTVVDARISALTASKLTGALPAISGANLTGITSGGLTQLVNFATTTGTTVTSPTLNLSTYKLIYIVINRLGFAADTGGSLQFTPNGGTIVNAYGGFANANNLYGSHWVDLSTGIGMGTVNIGYPAAAIITGEGAVRTFVNTGLTTSTTSIAWTTAGGVTFDSGNIIIYGLK